MAQAGLYYAELALSRPVAGSGRESMTFVTPWLATVCAITEAVPGDVLSERQAS
jgi:hypothetical protein